MTPADPAAVADTGERLAALYRQIATRMRELPVYNPRLDVQAVGFRSFGDHVLGVLITPWFMNLVLAALDGGPPLPEARRGDLRPVQFPAGPVDFVVGEVQDFGRLDSASLFSPMGAFDDPAVARETAAAALVALLDPDLPDRALGDAAPSLTRAKATDRRALLFGRGAS